MLRQLGPLVLVASISAIPIPGTAWCESGEPAGLAGVPVYDYELINTYPHDMHAFTQGLIYRDGFIYEGTGLYGQSSLRKVRLETGEVLKIHHLPEEYFGEGITSYGDTIFQLTWESNIAFAYLELDTFKLVSSFSYPYVGWGLTHDDSSLILSDGTHRLYRLDPRTFQELGRTEVTANGTRVSGLNELEYIQGKIYANIIDSGYIAIIDPQTGTLLGRIDLRDMHTTRGVHNGIAYDPETFRLFVTGKRWEHLYEIAVDPINYPPEIVSASPPSPTWIGADSTITLSIHCQDPDPGDHLEYAWSINGAIDTSAHDTSYAYSSPAPTVAAAVARVSDGMFSDSTSWILRVDIAGVSYSCPNPFSAETAIEFALPYGTHVNLGVYDPTGRLVTILFEGRLPAGPHQVIWDGRDSSARQVAPGLYFAHLRAGGIEDTRKMVRMR